MNPATATPIFRPGGIVYWLIWVLISIFIEY
jgi:hypothetical protein